MSQLNLSIPQSGQPNSTEDPKVASDLTAIQGVINGGIDAGNITPGSLIGSLIAANTITPDKLTSGSGSAPFLKLATVADKKVAFGTGSINLNGFASRSAAQATVTHGLGSTPTFVVVFPTNHVNITEDGNNHPVNFTATSVGSSTFLAIGEVNGTSSGTVNFCWMAVV